MESAFYCELTALDAEQRKNHQALAAQLRSAVLEVMELADGYAMRFPTEASVARQIAEFMMLERLCCPFFRLGMELEPDQGPLWLKITGGEGIKPFIRVEIGFAPVDELALFEPPE